MRKRVLLVLWNAEEAAERAALLRRAGYDVGCHSDPRLNPRTLLDDVPDAFVIDLGRAPSHGRELGGWLRRSRATRGVPMVFVGGEREKVDRVRKLLPDATYGEWRSVKAELAAAICCPPADPQIPGGMDAYVGTPLTKKLGLRDDQTVRLIGAPAGFESSLRPLPKGVDVSRKEPIAEVVLFFATSYEDLCTRFTKATGCMTEGGRIWILWPKKTSGVGSDLRQTVVRAHGLEHGLVDYKIASIDERWSGLCFARRKAEP